jgi:hypothetical protein
MRTTVVLPEPLPASVRVEPDPQGSVEWIERGNDAFTLRVTTDRPALLVVSENDYPAWHATIDGEVTPVLRANHAFRAVPVPAGTHEVHFFYENELLTASAGVSVALLTLLLVAALAGPIQRAFSGRAGKGSA